MLILNSDEVSQALPMAAAVEAMKQALIAISDGSANLPMRTHIDVAKHRGTTLVMPAYVAGKSTESLTVKVVSVFGDNPTNRDLPRIQAAVIVLDPETGKPAALLEGSTLTGIRTAAASGAATDALARSDSSTLAILGAGVQARSHVSAMLAVRPIKHVKIWSRDLDKVETMIDEMPKMGFDCEFEMSRTAGNAIADADIVCTVTTASDPLFDASEIREGTHLNVVGSYQAHVREVPSQTVAAARVFVDEVASALEEAGDIILAIQEGLIKADHILGTVGQVLNQEIAGRISGSDITIFKSVGNAAEDALAAAVTLQNANRMSLGTNVNF